MIKVRSIVTSASGTPIAIATVLDPRESAVEKEA